MNKQNISCIIVRRISLYNLNINMVIVKSVIEIIKDICVSVSNSRIIGLSSQRYATYGLKVAVRIWLVFAANVAAASSNLGMVICFWFSFEKPRWWRSSRYLSCVGETGSHEGEPGDSPEHIQLATTNSLRPIVGITV